MLAGFDELSDTRAGFADDAAACDTLLQEAHIGTVTGGAFYRRPADGKRQLRFCFAKEMPVLRQACDQLRDAFAD
ncbi:hypothetical protein [Salinibacter altiplanensis]|uniref:hypothetical protein n=1 Tax=Salinibacter altiplanensis TaxID=1803181 RepID=UPI001E5D7236|nr:hypothetical protein [Salinibacter altiplanensis]